MEKETGIRGFVASIIKPGLSKDRQEQAEKAVKSALMTPEERKAQEIKFQEILAKQRTTGQIPVKPYEQFTRGV